MVMAGYFSKSLLSEKIDKAQELAQAKNNI